jgi:G3E family GTPase
VLCGQSRTLRDDLILHLVSRRPGLVAVVYDADAVGTDVVVRRRTLDITGTVDASELMLAHGCVSCTVRGDVVGAAFDVAADGRWSEMLLGLPVPVLPQPITQILGHAVEDSAAVGSLLRLDGVTTLVDAVLLREHLNEDELLTGRGLGAAPTDPRSMAELLCAQLDQADVVAVAHLERVATRVARTVEGLVTHLAPLSVQVPLGPGGTGCEQLVSTGRAGSDDPFERARLSALAHQFIEPFGDVQTLLWRSARPLHPFRLYDALALIVPAVVRSTGQVELANRPGVPLLWESTGSSFSIAVADADEAMVAGNELVLTGVGMSPDRLAALLDSCLLTEAERAGPGWSALADPFTGALGPAEWLPTRPDGS